MRDFNRKAILDANNIRRQKPKTGIEPGEADLDVDDDGDWEHLYDEIIHSDRAERASRAEKKANKTFEK